MKATFKVFKKGDTATAVAEGPKPAIKGLKAGTEVKAGDYVMVAVDPDGNFSQSDTADVAAFTVPAASEG